MDVHLNFINQSNADRTDIVIFQKNMASRSGNTAVAWLVIEDSVPGSHYPFIYSYTVEVTAIDENGHETRMIQANNGELYRVYSTSSGSDISEVAPVVNQASIQVKNDLQIGNIVANIYRDGKLLATKTAIAPQQKAVFQFNPTIWVGVVSQINQGEVINQAMLSDVITQISLLGITAADIIMTGGGIGPTAQPFNFALANIKFTAGE